MDTRGAMDGGGSSSILRQKWGIDDNTGIKICALYKQRICRRLAFLRKGGQDHIQNFPVVIIDHFN